jgi:hypothetical protein
MRVRGASDLASLRARLSIAFTPDAAIARAVALGRVAWPELAATVPTVAGLALEAILPPAMRIESRRAIGADDLEILEAIVVGNAVDVIEDQRHPATAPHLVLATQLAYPRLQTGLEQARLEVRAWIARPFDQDMAQGDWISLKCVVARAIRIEVVGWYLPYLLDVPAEGPMVAPSRAHAQSPEGVRVAARRRHGGTRFLLGVSRPSRRHERMFASAGDATAYWGAWTRTRT